MKKQKYNNPCIYYDDEFNQKRFKHKQPNKNQPPDTVQVVSNKIDKDILNRYYFPEDTPKENGQQSLSSSATERKRKGNSPSQRISRKLNNKSLTLSQRSTKKYLENELSKLTNDNLNKKQQLRKEKLGKIKQSEVMELYRIISFYEGKLKSIQSQVKRYEQALQKIGKQCDEKARHKTQVQQMVKIFSDLRTQNEELSGKLEESDYKYGCLEQRSHKNQIKLNFLTCRYNFSKKHADSSNSKSRFSQSEIQKRNITPISLKDKKQSYGNIQSKINKMEATLHFLKKENDNLSERIEEKEVKILELEKKIKVYESKINRLNSSLSRKQSKIEGGQSKQMDQTKKRYSKPPLLNQGKRIARQDKKTSPSPCMMESSKQKTALVLNKKNQLLYSLEKRSYSKQDHLNKCVLISTPTTQQKPEKEGLNENSSLKEQSFNMEGTESKNIQKYENQNGCIDQDSRISQKKNHQEQSNISYPKDKQSNQFHESKISNISKVSALENGTGRQMLIEKAKSSLNISVFLKLKYQLLTDQLSFDDFIKQLGKDQICPQFFEQQPFNLDDLEAQQFYEWVSGIKEQSEEIGQELQAILIQAIPKFSNITFKKQRDYKIQIANEMRNREEEVYSKMEERIDDLSLQQIKNMILSWGLLESHLDVFCKAYYEETKNVMQFDWNTVRQIISKWGTDAEGNKF